MKCPLACIGENDIDNIKTNEAFDCLEEMCAWWDKQCGQCILITVGNALNNIASKSK